MCGGAGDIASGTIYRLHRCGYPVLALEAPVPTAIRRQAAFSEAVYDGTSQVEDVGGVCISRFAEAAAVWEQGLYLF